MSTPPPSGDHGRQGWDQRSYPVPGGYASPYPAHPGAPLGQPPVGAPQLGHPQPSTGALAWGLGLLVLALFPFISSVIASVAMIVVGRGGRRRGPLAAANGLNAANWGLTYLIATLILVPGHFLLLYLLTRDGPVEGFFPLGIVITLWAAITLVHLAVSVVGLIKASNGKVLRVPAIPFFRVRPPA